MTLGEKIKQIRKNQRITQKALAGEFVTQNMISSIESDKVKPSLETLQYIAGKLKTPSGYFLSETDDLFSFLKAEKIARVRTLFANENYALCIKILESLPGVDDETAYLLCESYLKLGTVSVRNGSLTTAKRQLETSLKYASQTCYSVGHAKTVAPIYLSIARNVQAPLLEFNQDSYEKSAIALCDYEFARYLQKDLDFPYSDEGIKKHVEAKKMLNQHRYADCFRILSEIENAPVDFPYHAFVMFGVYGDMEQCCKELGDFEGAYRYSTKRISLLEGFNG